MVHFPPFRQSVQGAISSVQHRLKRYRQLPPNGLAVFCGDVSTEAGGTKRILVDFEPLRPLSRSGYTCDSRFHAEEMVAMLDEEEGDAYGFIVVDGRWDKSSCCCC